MTHSLATLIQQTYDNALKSGDLLFFEAEHAVKDSNGIKFEITYAPTLAQKPHHESAGTDDNKKKAKINPFLPPHPSLKVKDLDEHTVVLNKYCVVPHHALIVTKEYKSQTQPLFPEDLVATWKCMTTAYGYTPAMAFYNCGPFSGASQPHKHIQILPLTKEQPQPPIKALYNQIQERKAGQIYVLDKLPFVHVMTPLDRSFIDSCSDNHEALGDYLGQMFFGLLDAMFQQMRKHAEPSRETSYNFIMTNDFMMMVPRSSEIANMNGLQLSINSLGFAGMLLVRTKEELDTMQQYPDLLDLLAQVGFRWNPDAEPDVEQ
ncbi:hypothetical protein LRAMOSA05122 [Lichtheimia ramosa]|uniref:Uncharacterized protein n=1 Tax=Lichtheimia ramosa TaxID=688394 RepID=A0A077X143_9FUNG|nr:hypothetical protein LRAMOSA05122 [Lichtheimia ramosa]